MAENKTVRFGQKLRGAVLIMVVTVMFMLIILLLATLTVVSTAQNRAYLKYEENQAYYTARSALDIYVEEMLKDNEYNAYKTDNSTVRTYSYTKPDALIKDNVDDREAGVTTSTYMRQGLALEMELYKIKAKNDAGLVSNFKPTDYIFGDASHDIPEDINYSASVDGSQKFDLNEITYTISFPKMTDGSADDYGRFVDKNSSGDDEAKIVVTVEYRRFNMGGSKAAALSQMTDAQLKSISDLATDSATIKIDGVDYTKKDLKDAIRLGDRTKDDMRIKVTATATFMGVDGTAALYYNTTEKPVPKSSNAITSVSDITTTADSISPIGGASSLKGGITVKNNGNIVGDVYSIGDLVMPSGSDFYLFGNTVDAIRGNVDFQAGAPIVCGDGAILYADGTITFTNAGTNFGATDKNVNIIADTIKFASAGSMDTIYHGMMFCNSVEITDTNKTPRFGNSDGKIYANYLIINSGVSAVNTTDGFVFETSFKPKSALSISKGIIYNGVTYNYDTALSLTDGTNIYTIENNPGFYDPSNVINVSYTDKNAYIITADGNKKFNDLPVELKGRSEKYFEISTTKSLYSQIFRDDAFENDKNLGTYGDLNNLKPQLPLTVDYTQTVIIPPAQSWESEITYSMSDSINGPLFIDGTINDSNWTAYYGYDWGKYDSDRKAANYFYNTASDKLLEDIQKVVDNPEVDLGDADYKAKIEKYIDDLNKYYAKYISSAEKINEKIGESDPNSVPASLLYFTTTGSGERGQQVVLKEISLGTEDEKKANPWVPSEVIGSDKKVYVIDSSGYITPKQNNNYNIFGNSSMNDPVVIDARNNPITIQLGAENGLGTNQVHDSVAKFNGFFVVVGDNPVKIYLPDGRDYWFGSEDASTHSFSVMSYDIFKIIKEGGTLALGDDGSSGLTKAPNIHIYAGNKVNKIYIPQATSLITGYIYAPFAEYYIQTGSGTLFKKVTYNGQTITKYSSDNGGGCGLGVIGSVICGSYKNQNNVGVAYINASQASYQHGDTQFLWTKHQYTRN